MNGQRLCGQMSQYLNSFHEEDPLLEGEWVRGSILIVLCQQLNMVGEYSGLGLHVSRWSWHALSCGRSIKCFSIHRLNFSHFKNDGEKIIGGDFIFQQDGASCHTAKHSMAWFSSNGISVLPWPSQSADLNPIEHLWEVIKKRMDKSPVKNKAELKELIFSTWNSIKPAITANLVDSMGRRCQAVIAAHGGLTKY